MHDEVPHYQAEEKGQEAAVTFGAAEAVDDEAWRKDLKDLTPFVLEQAIAIWLPVSHKYNCWQPWLKNYYGANRIAAFLPYHYTYYNWIDQDLKAKILGN